MPSTILRARSRRPLALLVTCEHGGNRIPPAYRCWFADAEVSLSSHLGYDPGSLSMARSLAATLSAPLIAATISRLLVELNRSPSHPRLFSPMIRRAPPQIRKAIFERYYVPYRMRVTEAVASAVARGAQVLHISSHSFTPVFDGVTRGADVGLLFDPGRPREAEFCARWRRALMVRAPGWTVRRNYPYQGTSDGLPTWLRRRYPDAGYAGIELEINQKHAFAPPGDQRLLRAVVCAALRDALGAGQARPPVLKRAS